MADLPSITVDISGLPASSIDKSPPWNAYDASTNRRHWKPPFHPPDDLGTPALTDGTSQVSDYGDTRHLEHPDRFTRRLSVLQISDAFVQIGGQVPKTPDSGQLEPWDARSTGGESISLRSNSDSTPTLSDLIREKGRDAVSAEGRTFFPISDLEEVVTRTAARQELGDGPDVDVILDHIFVPRAISNHKTRAFKTFIILTLMDKSEAIRDFIDDEIYDLDLPFQRPAAGGTLKNKNQYIRNPQILGRSRSEISIFKRWAAAETDNFVEKQHSVCVPIFDFDTQPGASVSHYNLHGHTILPYIENDENDLPGKGRSDVWRIKLHPAHIICQGFDPNMSLAVKKLQHRVGRLLTEETEKFIREASYLRRFASRDHDFLIKLLCTFQWRGHYYFLFPWADGDLYDFWSRHPDPLAPLKQPSTARWLSTQCLGLATALRDIHHGNSQSTLHLAPHQKNHGKHGDIKPENILYFKIDSKDDATTNEACRVRLKISDLGEAEFHSTTSMEVDAMGVLSTPSYSAPELRVKKVSMPSYDTFSLACVLLEFVTWYLHGSREVESFRTKRLKEREEPVYSFHASGDFKVDSFFKHVTVRMDESRRIGAMHKSSVTQEIVNLCEDEHCSDYVLDLLVFIQDHLLRMNPKNRANFDTVYKRFREFDQKCRVNELYCVKRSNRVRVRSRSNLSLITEFDNELSEKIGINGTIPAETDMEKIVLIEPSPPPSSVILDFEDSSLGIGTSVDLTSKTYPTIDPSTEATQVTCEADKDDVSIYSADTTASLRQESDRYEAVLTKVLLEYLLSVSNDEESLQRAADVLPKYLQRFSRKLSAERPSKMHREVMRFVQKHRMSIASTLQEELDLELNAAPIRSDHNMPFGEKVGDWLKHNGEFATLPIHDTTDYVRRSDTDQVNYRSDRDGDRDDGRGGESDGNSDGESHSEEDSIENAPNIHEYRQVVTESTAYRWLKSDLRRELLFTYPSQANIGDTLSKAVLSPRIFSHISRTAAAVRCLVLYEVDWDPIDFLQEQEYGCDSVEAFRKALTLTGIANEAEGLACEEYMHRTWPQTATAFLDLMQMLLTSKEGQNSQINLEDGTSLVASLQHSKVQLEASGYPDIIVEIGEQLAWVSSSMCPSDIPTGATCCTPTIEKANVKESDNFVSMTIRLTRSVQKRVGEDDSGADCWRRLFRNPTIVEGFPIRRRAQPGTGMELSITTMAALTRAKRISVFKDDFFIKGFSMMLVAVKAIGNIMLWHALVNEDGSDIKYHDARIQTIHFPADKAAVTLAQLPSMRHVLGWCSHVKSFAGASDARFNIGRCALRSPGFGFALEKINIGMSKYINANATIGLGQRDTPIYASRTSQLYVDQISGLCEQYVVLYDVEKQRAWLVDGASALLHLLRLSLVMNEENKIALVHGHKDLDRSQPTDGSVNPFQVLTESMNLKLYKMPDVENITIEQKWSGKARPHQSLIDRQVTESCKQTWYCVKDRFDLLYSSLDEIFQHHSDMSSSGVRFKIQSSPRTQLEGFEFRDIASGVKPIRPFATTLPAGGEVWVDLIRELQAVTLFGRGFGEIFEPTSTMASTPATDPLKTQKICRHWERLPAKHGYLATSNSILNKLLKLNGDTDTDGKPWRLVKGVYVHSATPVFDSCRCDTDESHGCDRVLALLPEGRQSNRASHCLTTLPPETGAVIFGKRPSNVLRKVDEKGKGKAPEELAVPVLEDEPSDHSVMADSSTGAVSQSVGPDIMASTQPSTVGDSSLLSAGTTVSRTSVGGISDATGATSGTRGAQLAPSPKPAVPERAQAQKPRLLQRAVAGLKRTMARGSKRNE